MMHSHPFQLSASYQNLYLPMNILSIHIWSSLTFSLSNTSKANIGILSACFWLKSHVHLNSMAYFVCLYAYTNNISLPIALYLSAFIRIYWVTNSPDKNVVDKNCFFLIHIIY
jgi:hypothetical protein